MNNFQSKEKISEMGGDHNNKQQNKRHKHNLSFNKFWIVDRISKSWIKAKTIQ